MTLKMALVENTAGQGHLTNGHAVLQERAGLLDAAVHPVGVGR